MNELMMGSGAVVSIVGLIVAVLLQTVMIGRWTGRIDQVLKGLADNLARHDTEIVRLRDGRHKADGTLARHEGILRELGRRALWWEEHTASQSADEKEKEKC